MNLCDPNRNRPFPSKGEPSNPQPSQPFPSTGASAGNFKFSTLEIQHLPCKIDGETEHLFLACLNGKVVGSVTTRIWPDKSCGVRRMFVTPSERGKGVATRLLAKVEAFAKQERASHLEISCNRGNVNARQFWVRRKFYDDPEREARPDPLRYVCMVKPI